MSFVRCLIIVFSFVVPSAAWSQQSAGTELPARPNALYWPVNPYLLQSYFWALQNQRIPFPTPFWLWPTLPPQYPPSAPAASTPPPQSSVPDASSGVPTVPAAVAPPVAQESVTNTPPKLPLPSPEAATGPSPAFEPQVQSIAPAVNALPAPAKTEPEPAVAQPEIVAAPKKTPQPSDAQTTPQKPKVAKKKAPRKLRKLCWKDGKLDICP